jgi:hypothetical protein
MAVVEAENLLEGYRVPRDFLPTTLYPMFLGMRKNPELKEVFEPYLYGVKLIDLVDSLHPRIASYLPTRRGEYDLCSARRSGSRETLFANTSHMWNGADQIRQALLIGSKLCQEDATMEHLLTLHEQLKFELNKVVVETRRTLFVANHLEQKLFDKALTLLRVVPPSSYHTIAPHLCDEAGVNFWQLSRLFEICELMAERIEIPRRALTDLEYLGGIASLRQLVNDYDAQWIANTIHHYENQLRYYIDDDRKRVIDMLLKLAPCTDAYPRFREVVRVQ